MSYSRINLTSSNEDSTPEGGNKTDSKLQKAIFCENCCPKLCDSCQQVLAALVQRNKECSRLYDISAFQVAMRRMPALLLTMVLELIGGLVIRKFNWVMKQFILLASFMPIIHALSGNLGLQTASNITRGLATGHVDRNKFKSEFKKEGLTGLFCSISIALLLGSIAAIWVVLSNKEKHFKSEIELYPLIFGGVVLLGTLLSMIISSTNGSVVPFLALKLKLDPAKFAGPLETAFQDIAGSAFLLGLAALILYPKLPEKQTVFCSTVDPTTAA